MLRSLVRRVHSRFSHFNRVKILSELMTGMIRKNFDFSHRPLNILDVGCGDLALGLRIRENLLPLNVGLTGIDLFEEVLATEGSGNLYQQFDGLHIPFQNDSYDLCILSDVLHHDWKHATHLMSEVKRVSEYVLLKDHFEFGTMSRRVLQFMDFIGNWGYHVSIPRRYFNYDTFSDFVKEHDFSIIDSINSIELYQHLPVVKHLAKSKYQFLILLRRS